MEKINKSRLENIETLNGPRLLILSSGAIAKNPISFYLNNFTLRGFFVVNLKDIFVRILNY